MSSGKNNYRSRCMNRVADCDAMATSQKRHRLDYNVFTGTATYQICGYGSQCNQKHTICMLAFNILRGFDLIYNVHVATGMPTPLCPH